MEDIWLGSVVYRQPLRQPISYVALSEKDDHTLVSDGWGLKVTRSALVVHMKYHRPGKQVGRPRLGPAHWSIGPSCYLLHAIAERSRALLHAIAPCMAQRACLLALVLCLGRSPRARATAGGTRRPAAHAPSPSLACGSHPPIPQCLRDPRQFLTPTAIRIAAIDTHALVQIERFLVADAFLRRNFCRERLAVTCRSGCVGFLNRQENQTLQSDPRFAQAWATRIQGAAFCTGGQSSAAYCRVGATPPRKCPARPKDLLSPRGSSLNGDLAQQATRALNDTTRLVQAANEGKRP